MCLPNARLTEIAIDVAVPTRPVQNMASAANASNHIGKMVNCRAVYSLPNWKKLTIGL